jgi:hypothetical protein
VVVSAAIHESCFWRCGRVLALFFTLFLASSIFHLPFPFEIGAVLLRPISIFTIYQSAASPAFSIRKSAFGIFASSLSP